MTRSNTIWAHLEINVLPSISTLVLSQFLNSSRSSGGNICFEDEHLSNLSQDHLRDYLRVVEISTGPKHRIEIRRKSNWSQFLTVTLANFLQRCQCAIVLNCKRFPVPSLIVDACLRGNCNIVELHLLWLPGIDGLVRALAKNKSLVRLHFTDVRISDDNWTVLCQSISRHPKLEYLRLLHTFPRGPQQHSKDRKTRRTNVFLKMLQTNTVLQGLGVRWGATDPHDEFDERILSDVIQPYCRRIRHVRAFGKYRGLRYRQVLARALYKVDDSPALLAMLIRSNIPAILGFGEDN
jgi:hypothetical protein